MRRHMWTLLDRIEAPTWLVAIAIYGGWGLLTWYGTVLPWWLVLPAGAWLVAWHNSLQHETIHGHPTRDAVVNEAIALPPLGLWLPYPLYRDRHRRHHATSDLTVPDRDPESDYLTPRRWNAMGAVGRALWRFNRCLAGRLTIGPAIAMVQSGARNAVAWARAIGAIWAYGCRTGCWCLPRWSG